MTKTINLKIGVSGVRGIVGDFLDPTLVTGFAAAFGNYVGGGRVVVGRDTRATGPMFESAAVAGLLAVGCQPVVIGVAPTPTVMITVDRMRANGGVVISASHNPQEWNALKFISSKGVFLSEAEAMELLNIYNQPDDAFAKELDYRNMRSLDDAFVEHKRRVFANVDRARVVKAKLKVAVDCCNGVGAVYSKPFLEELGCEVVGVHDQPDGRFRRPPEPLPENLGELTKAVKRHHCAVGFAQDPDGDRIALVDETGVALDEQRSLVLAVSRILAKTPGNVVVNAQTTKAVDDVAARYGCEVFRAKVGEINVVAEMIARDAVIGGEGNCGGVIWPAVHHCRDSFASMALILETLAVTGRPLSDIVTELPAYHIRNAKLRWSADEATRITRALTSRLNGPRVSTVDGLRIDEDDGWILIRPSNTEPVLRVTAEAKTSERAEALLNEYVEMIKNM